MIDKSRTRLRSEARAKIRQELDWARKCGPVTVRFVDPSTLPPPKAKPRRPRKGS